MIEDLDVIPRPDYDLIPMEHYFTRAPSTNEAQLQVVTSRGCPFDCEFCYNLKFNEKRFRYHSAERVLSDILYLQERFGVDAIFIEDDYFFGHPGRVQKICDLLIEHDCKLLIQVPCRIDYLYRQTDEMIEKLYRAGFKELWIGVESGSESRLKEIMKRMSLKQVLDVNEMLARSDVYIKYGFMAGFPNEERQETLETVDFMFRLLSTNPNAGVAPVAVYTPYPGHHAVRQDQAQPRREVPGHPGRLESFSLRREQQPLSVPPSEEVHHQGQRHEPLLRAAGVRTVLRQPFQAAADGALLALLPLSSPAVPLEVFRVHARNSADPFPRADVHPDLPPLTAGPRLPPALRVTGPGGAAGFTEPPAKRFGAKARGWQILLPVVRAFPSPTSFV